MRFWRAGVLLFGLLGAHHARADQTVPPPVAPAQPIKPESGAGASVIKPQAVDPGIKAKTPPPEKFPMPVIVPRTVPAPKP